MTTTALRMFLIVLCIGIYLFTSQSRTPVTIRTVTTVNNGIIIILKFM